MNFLNTPTEVAYATDVEQKDTGLANAAHRRDVQFAGIWGSPPIIELGVKPVPRRDGDEGVDWCLRFLPQR